MMSSRPNATELLELLSWNVARASAGNLSLTAPSGHLLQFKEDAEHYKCDKCGGRSKKGHLCGIMLRWGCSESEYDICFACVQSELGAAAPLTLTTHQASGRDISQASLDEETALVADLNATLELRVKQLEVRE